MNFLKDGTDKKLLTFPVDLDWNLRKFLKLLKIHEIPEITKVSSEGAIGFFFHCSYLQGLSIACRYFCPKYRCLCVCVVLRMMECLDLNGDVNILGYWMLGTG